MPQKTNLNINPYYDDFDKEDNYYKVLFKPGYPIQSRELSNLQSILQNQIESFGSHIFKEGSMVIPGGVTFDDRFYSIKVNPQHLGIDITVYLDALVDSKVRVRGQNSSIVASIKKYILPPEEGVEDITIFLKYLESDSNTNSTSFPDGETLILEENVTYGNTTLNAGDTILTLISQNATYVGSALGVSKGVYFIRGTFVDVPTTQIILDPYSNTPSYRVGFNISEEIITSNDDQTLNDNAKGFSNYAAPGADRFKISVQLSKKDLLDFNDTNFVELVKIDDGEIKKLQNTSVYSEIKKYFAQRTYDESGDYSISPFTIQVSDSLNDEISSDGIFTENQLTEEGNVPSDDLMCVKVSSGKAYVKGYDIDLVGSSVLDSKKPRDQNTIDSALIPFSMGSLIKVNNVFGSPYINIGDPQGTGSNVISLYNRRRDANASPTSPTGTKIGEARVYWYGVSNAPYTDASSEWDLYLFDIQTYTTLSLSLDFTNAEVPLSSYIRGLSSGATGYLANKPAPNQYSLVQTSGTFVQGEQVIINENLSLTTTINSLIAYTTEDIKSVYQDADTLSNNQLQTDFVADTVLYAKQLPRFSPSDVLNIDRGGVATSPGKLFAGTTGIKTDSIIQYQRGSLTVPTYNRVSFVSADGTSMTLAALDNTGTVTGVANGSLSGIATSSNFSVVVPKITKLDESGLFLNLPKKNISSLNLDNSNLIVTRQINGQSVDANGNLTISSSTALNPTSGITTAFFEPYDAEKYSIHYSNGSTEPLTSSQVTLGANGNSITFSGLTPSATNVSVICTLKKLSIASKTKNYVRSSSIVISGSAGINTASTGLTTSRFYGTRVEDREISLNLPDVSKVIAVYESTNTNNPILDKLTFVSGLSLDVNSIVGEKIVGSDSRAIGQLVNRVSSTEVEFVYLNSSRFSLGETVEFRESKIRSNIQTITNGSYVDRTSDFTLDKGHRLQYCDYSRIVRRENGPLPSKRILVIFDYYEVSQGNSGDAFTVNSYTQDRYSKDIPVLPNDTRVTDTIDFRPRVTPFVATNASPFAFSSRSFESTFGYSITPNESSLIGYSYYLPRTDKLTINTLGEVSVIEGISSDDPKMPSDIDNVMDIAKIEYPPYLYNASTDPKITLIDNRRFTMRDIAKLENRIKNLEVTTSLSALELDTKTLQVTDSSGLNRFKTGFVVDNFKNRDFIDFSDNDVKCDVNIDREELISAVDNWSLGAEIALDPGINRNTADLNQNLNLLDSNTQKTGDILTLAYNEVDWIEQPHASNVENVNPFNVLAFVGGIVLDPPSDNWTRTIYINSSRTESTGAVWSEKANTVQDVQVTLQGKKETTTTTSTTTFTNVLEGPSREFNYLESVKISGEADPYMRSRNVYFAANGLKPFTKHYHYLDAQQIDIVPKLVEIDMIQGSFIPFENAKIYDLAGQQVGRIRIQVPNQKFSDTTRPDIGGGLGTPDQIVETYTVDPYDRTRPAPGTTYSPTSKLLNFGVRVLADNSGRWYGYVEKGMSVVGEDSNAFARITRAELISDNWGDIIGSFFFRNPIPTPRILVKSGTKTFKVTATPPGVTPLPGSTAFASESQTTYHASGTILTQESRNVSVRNPPKPATRKTEVNVKVKATHRDPLAQSFRVDGANGNFLTSFDVYFASKDPNAKIFVELRTVELGTPTNFLVQDYTQVALNPSSINVSNDASVPTNIRFRSPVYLQPDTEYALVFLSPASDLYEMWVATMGEKSIQTANLPNASSVVIGKQYIGGSLFKSQNGTIWTPSQYQDLTFKLYKAEFVANGSLTFYNSPILPGNINANILPSNPIKTLPKKVRVPVTGTAGLTQTATPILAPGTLIGEGSVNSTSATGIIENIGAPILTTSISSEGSGYVDATYTNVSLFSINGFGSGAEATVVISGGVVSSVTITNNGIGYVSGETLGITTSSLGNSGKGTGAVISVNSINSTVDTLYLTSVQGEQFNSGQTLVYYSGGTLGGTRIATGASINGPSSILEEKYNGNVFKVSQYNHAHHGLNNTIKIESVEPDSPITQLTADLITTSSVVSVADTAPFSTFEGISTTSGYALVASEIISYSDIGLGSLSINGRGMDFTANTYHPAGTNIRPYECSGVSLRRINTTHTLPSNQDLLNLVGIDEYYLEFDRGGRTSGSNQLNFSEEKSIGGNKTKISQNHQFSTIVPQFNFITPGKGTSISAQLRTISGTSAGGNEVSFIDQGYEPVSMNNANFMTTPRLVASEINETEKLTSLPLNKSLTLRVDLSSSDSDLSPVLDIKNAIFVLGRNKIDNPISDYASDSRSNNLSGDPHGSVFISKRIDLKQPASSLKVILAANRPPQVDFRVFYRLFKADSSNIDQSYIAFPGYDNLIDTDGDGFGDLVINPNNSNGKSDAYVSPNTFGGFSEYEFTANNLDSFNGFTIKIVMSSTNESETLRIKDFRAIALA